MDLVTRTSPWTSVQGLLWFYGILVDMLNKARNFYQLSTATTIQNSGIGNNTLSKPAGEEVASIVPGKKYSVYIPSAATFTTSFNTDEGNFSILFYTKPDNGQLLTVAGNTVAYTDGIFSMTNDVGDSLVIPENSRRAHLVHFTYNNGEVSFFVDGQGGSIPGATIETTGPAAVTLLSGGGILDNVAATIGEFSGLEALQNEYGTFVPVAMPVSLLFDGAREAVEERLITDNLSVSAGSSQLIGIPSVECMAFKIRYDLAGRGNVLINGVSAASGTQFSEPPVSIEVIAQTNCTLSNVVITEYYSDDMFITFGAAETVGVSGTPAPTHRHDNNSANLGDTLVTPSITLGTVGGWFYAEDGNPLPGVSMSNGVLTGTELYVNGKPYTGGATVRDWYFLVRTASVSSPFTIDVPVHALIGSSTTYDADMIDDLYESFFGNPVLTPADETVTLVEEPALVISTEWSIVSSG